VLPFRRRAVKPLRRKRSRWLGLVRPFAGALVLVGGPLALAAWAAGSPRFALSEVAVSPTERVPAAWVRRQLAPLAGRNLPALALDEVRARLAGHPWIAGVELSKRLPRTLAVAVVERRPAALVTEAGALWLADAAGRPIAPAAEGDTEGLVLVTEAGPAPADEATGGASGEGAGERAGATAGGGVPLALAVAGELKQRRPGWAEGLTWIEVLGAEEVRLHTASLPFPLLVRSGHLEPAAARLAELLPEIERRYPRLEAVDLRYARRIVMRPGDGAGAVETVKG
jgi:cell division protein FtsQ